MFAEVQGTFSFQFVVSCAICFAAVCNKCTVESINDRFCKMFFLFIKQLLMGTNVRDEYGLLDTVVALVAPLRHPPRAGTVGRGSCYRLSNV